MKTELQIVNSMLVSINNAPTQSLEKNTSPDVYNARSILNDTKTSILAKNWMCNTDELTIVPNIEKQCVLPNNILKTTPYTRGVVDRGGKLYDKQRTTYSFENPQKIRVIINLPFEDIPIELVDYIEATAVYKFYKTYGGDPDMVKYYYQDSIDKRSVALSADFRDRKNNGSTFTGVYINYGGM